MGGHHYPIVVQVLALVQMDAQVVTLVPQSVLYKTGKVGIPQVRQQIHLVDLVAVDSAAGASSSLARTIVERDPSRLAAIIAVLRAPGVVPMRTALGARTTETTRVLDEVAARHPAMAEVLWRTKVDISRWDVPRGC